MKKLKRLEKRAGELRVRWLQQQQVEQQLPHPGAALEPIRRLLLPVFAEKRQEEKKDTFMEKLATQVIKNLQVKISSIHLRYEDDVSSDEARNDLKTTLRPGPGQLDLFSVLQLSDPQQPVCVGLTLSEMSLQVELRAGAHVHAHAHADGAAEQLLCVSDHG